MSSASGRSAHQKEYKLYKRRWAFLLTLSTLQVIFGFSYSCFGQVSNVLHEFFLVSYSEVNWLTLAVDIGPIVLSFPFSWITILKWYTFRTLALTAAFGFTIGFVFLTSSIASRSLYPLMLVGQIINGVGATALITSPSTFAVLWFPEHQVGTAIAVNLMSIYLGNIFGLTLMPNVLSTSTPSNATTSDETWIVEDQQKMVPIFSSLLFIALASAVFLFIYVTDHPPSPPTRAQEIELQKNEQDVEDMSLTSYTQLVKSLLTNRTYLLACFIFGTLFQVLVVEFVMLPQLLRQMFAKGSVQRDADVIGGYIMSTKCIGDIFGALAGGLLVNRYKRYNVICIVSCSLVFLSTLGMVIAFLTNTLSTFFVSIAVFGLFRQVGVVVIYEIVTQETYPIDEKFVTIWLTGITMTMGIFNAEMGSILFNSLGGLAVLIFQSASVLISLLFSCLLRTENKRLIVNESYSDDVTDNMDECNVLISNR